ncbi:MAG: hypothetical protein ACLQVF_02040 [Isosphaeraceae bacterium]
MHFFSRFISSLPRDSQARQGRRSNVRRHCRIELERLEGRALMSIQGVTLTFYGNLSITAQQPSGTVALVAIDPSTKNVQVSFNGQSEEFSASSVHSITYTGGTNGGDTFTNDTGIAELAYGNGGNNDFTGGTGINVVYFTGNDNTYYGPAGSTSDVFKDYGQADTITGPGKLYVFNS